MGIMGGLADADPITVEYEVTVIDDTSEVWCEIADWFDEQGFWFKSFVADMKSTTYVFDQLEHATLFRLRFG